MAAFAFVLSGVFLSAWKFYNSGMALAVAPWVMAASAKLARAGAPKRAAAELGLWGALEVLAGEPVIALLVFAFAVGRVVAEALVARTLVAARLLGLAIGIALAALIAAPQILLTAQIVRGSSREERPFPFVTATGTSVHPMLALEQVMPFPFGRPDLTGPAGFSGHAWFDNHSRTYRSVVLVALASSAGVTGPSVAIPHFPCEKSSHCFQFVSCCQALSGEVLLRRVQ